MKKICKVEIDVNDVQKKESVLCSETNTECDIKEYNNNIELSKNESSNSIPPKIIFGNYNLKKLKSFKKIRRSLKLKNMKYYFINDLSVVLNEYPPTDEMNDFNDELLLTVLDIAESYFFYPKNKQDREDTKRECVISLMLPYYRNDRKLLEKTISLVNHKIKKSRLYTRLFQRFKYFFLTK